MYKLFATLALPCSLALAPAAWADATPRYGSFGIGVGTAGLGVDYAYPVADWLDLRAGYDFGSVKRDQTEDDIEYEAELKFSALRLQADYKPFKGGFRISAGVYASTPELELKANGEDEYDIGENTYNGDLDLDGDVDLGGAAPYLGIGWGGTAGTTGFGASFDVGVIFASSPKVDLDVRGAACDAGANPDCDPNDPAEPTRFEIGDGSDADRQFQADKDAEIRQLEDDAKDFDMWPVLRLGLHYRF